MNIYLINFYYDSGLISIAINIPENVTLVNIKYNANCIKFTVYMIDNEISINKNPKNIINRLQKKVLP